MSTNKDAWGIEVGSQAIKAIKLSRTTTGVALEDFDIMPFKQVLTTPDLNVEEAIRVNLESLAQKHEFDKSNVTVSVPGNMAFARFAKLPPIEANKVRSIVAYEAQQQIPFPIDEVEWDYEVFAQEDAPDIEVGIFAITKERVAHFLSNYRAVSVRVDTLTLSPVAVYNAFAYENANGSGHGDNTVYLDIGTNSTDIIVVESGSIWLRTLQLGGNHFTNALMKQLKISHAKAEKLKLEARTSKYAKHIFTATRGVMNELVTEIQRSLGFYTSLNRDAELTKIVGVGSTWKLPGLQKYLKQNLQMEVVRPDGFEQLQIDDRRAAEFSSVAGNMATAYGLALQGLGMGTVDANILPQSILQQRMMKAKQPWIAAAAACVAAAPLLGLSMMMLTDNSYSAALSTAKPGFDETVREAQNFKSKYDEVQTTDPRPGITNIRRSYDYSNLMSSLMEDVASAMATIEPNDALKNPDWNVPEDVQAIASLSRAERKLAWITDIETKYLPPASTGSASVFTDDGTGSGDTSGGGPGGSPGPGAMPGGFAIGPAETDLDNRVRPVVYPVAPFPKVPQPAAADPSATDETTGEEAPVDEVSPRITVVVRGVTTMDSSSISRLLQDKFVNWLDENSERGNRPYIIIPKLDDFRNTRRTLADNSSSSSRDEGIGAGVNSLRRTPTPKQLNPTTRPTPGTLPAPGNLGIPGADLQPEDKPAVSTTLEIQTPEGWYATLEQSSPSFSAGTLLPQRPLSTEDLTQDTVFTFSFDVILLPPDDARETLLYDPEAEPDESDEPSTPQAGPTNNNSRVEDQA